MRTVRVILIFLSLFVLSCATTNSNIKRIAAGDVNLFLNQAPKAEEHPNDGADLLYSYRYMEFYADGTSITRHLNRELQKHESSIKNIIFEKK